MKSLWKLIAVLLLLVPRVATATGGISGSKLATPNSETVPESSMEFEPYFSLADALSDLDGQWSAASRDREHRGFETGFRFTVGLLENLEAGLIVPVVFEKSWDEGASLSGTGLSDIATGVKWKFLGESGSGLAWHAGATLPTGHTEVGAAELPTGAGATLYETGLAGTLEPIPAISIDASLQAGLGVPTGAEGSFWQAGFDVAIGYVLGPLQLVAELNQAHTFTDTHDASLISTNLGFTWSLNERVIVVTGVSYDVAGKNETQSVSYNLAFTILL